MKALISFFTLLLISFSGYTQDVKELQETARSFMRQGDFTNSILVLSKASQIEPENMSLAKDLALSYYYKKDFDKALKSIKPVLESAEVDDQSFQIGANIYLSLGNFKEAETTYKNGLKKYPLSGPLYNDYGELLYGLKDSKAINMWESGIEADPSFPKNYYNTTRFYYLKGDLIKCILYGEIFLNMDPLNSKTPEIKDIIIDSYKRIFTYKDILAESKANNAFEKAFIETMNKQSNLASYGITVDVLTMVRTRFILDWFQNYETKFPFFLFDYQRQLLQQGMFDAYNQWLFGSSTNLKNFQTWINANGEQYSNFIRFHKSRLFKMPTGQFYK
ncbi:MAG: hypothetical protein ABIP68_08880 [Ferruginibacter sp.]